MNKNNYIRKVGNSCFHYAVKCKEMGLYGVAEALEDAYIRIRDIEHFEWYNEEVEE